MLLNCLIGSPAELRSAMDTMLAQVARLRPEAVVQGLTVQAMAERPGARVVDAEMELQIRQLHGIAQLLRVVAGRAAEQFRSQPRAGRDDRALSLLLCALRNQRWLGGGQAESGRRAVQLVLQVHQEYRCFENPRPLDRMST